MQVFLQSIWPSDALMFCGTLFCPESKKDSSLLFYASLRLVKSGGGVPPPYTGASASATRGRAVSGASEYGNSPSCVVKAGAAWQIACRQHCVQRGLRAVQSVAPRSIMA